MRDETILIGTDDSFDEIVGTLARILDVPAAVRGEGATDDVQFILDDTSWVDIEDWRLDPSSVSDPNYVGITYEIDVSGNVDERHQLEVAERVRDRLIASTNWKVRLIDQGPVDETHRSLRVPDGSTGRAAGSR